MKQWRVYNLIRAKSIKNLFDLLQSYGKLPTELIFGSVRHIQDDISSDPVAHSSQSPPREILSVHLFESIKEHGTDSRVLPLQWLQKTQHDLKSSFSLLPTEVSMVGDMDRIMRKKRAMLLSFDQGLEHGPKQFNTHTIDPEFIMNIALEGEFTGIIMQAGLAEKYHLMEYIDVPLIIKLNGRSELSQLNPVSKQLCSVERAVSLGADAVAYTVYDGSPAEPDMFAEFGRIVEEAHHFGIPVIAFMYPRTGSLDSDTLAYSARIGLELGADFVKVKYNNDPGGFDWVVKSAGRARVLTADSDHKSDEDILHHAADVVRRGATGIAYGRTIWTHPRPIALARALRAIVIDGKSVEDAKRFLQED